MNKKLVVVLCIMLCLVMLFAFVGCQAPVTTEVTEDVSEAADTEATDTEVADTEDTDAVVETGDAEVSGEPLQIGVAMADFAIPFFVRMMDGMEEQAEAMGAVVDIQDGQSDPNVQVGHIQNFITQEKDLIIIVAAQLDALVPVALECNEAGIPIVTVNRQLGEGADVLTYVGCDDVLGGSIQGELLQDLLGDEGKVVLMQGSLGSSPQVMREQGAEEYLAANAPGIEIIDKQTSEWDPSKALTVMQNFLATYGEGEIDAVLIQGPYEAVSAVEAIKASERDELLGKIVCFDLPQEVVDAIAVGDIYGTVLQDPQEQGRLGIETAVNYLTGELTEADIEPQTWTVLPKVCIDNIGDFGAAW